MSRIKVHRNKVLETTPVYDTYWRFAAERQSVFMKRANGESAPWTSDPIISGHRFTNTYRASDRVSQYLIKNVIYDGLQSANEVFFRTILFKIFNKIETWEMLRRTIGDLKWSKFSYDRYAKVLDQAKAMSPIYSAAYIMPSPSFSSPAKHRNHLRLIEYMFKNNVPKSVAKANSLEEVYKILLGLPSLGNFLAFQFAIDLNYSEIIDFSEMDFVVAGPGARNGIMKCFKAGHGLSSEDIIKIMTERAAEEFDRLGLKFQTLWGRPLQLIDCQNIFCETDKYARVAHPTFSGETKRTKIKQKFSKNLGAVPQWYPPKWNVKVPKKILIVKPSTSQATETPRQQSLL